MIRRLPLSSTILALMALAAVAQEDPLTRFDTDADGVLSRAEIEAAHTAAGRPGDPSTAATRVLERFDLDRDGVLAGTELDALAVALEERRARRAEERARSPRLDIAYVEGGHRLQTLDVYPAEGADAAPVIVYVHGGGWSKGDKSRVGAKAELFTGLGYVFVSLNYRLSPRVRHPAHIDDVTAGIAWVVGNIAEHGGDPARIGLIGHSAGAHLVALAATDEARLGAQGLGLDAVKAVVPVDIAMYDIARVFTIDPGSRWVSVFGDEPAGHRDASPLWHVEAGKGIPDFLFLMAGREQGKDRGIEQMAARLREVGVGAERVDAPRKTHGSINRELGEVDDFVQRAVVAFFAARLGVEGGTEERPSSGSDALPRD